MSTLSHWTAVLLLTCLLLAAPVKAAEAGGFAAIDRHRHRSRSLAAVKNTTWWKPKRYNKDGTFPRFQYQLSDEGTIKYVSGVQVYVIDLDTALSAIPKLKSKNAAVRVVCYFSAGSWEDYRVQADRRFRGVRPSDWGAALGKDMDGWPGERWVDVRSSKVRTILRRRIAWAKKIGCHGVDPDNVNGHDADTGFPLTKANLVAFNKWLASTAHGFGLGIGLKNGLDMIRQLHTLFDWAVNESCNVYEECDLYDTFAATKPIWGIEYCDANEVFGVHTMDPACFCPRMMKKGFNFLYKAVNLTAQGIDCARYCAANKQKCAQGAAVTGSCKSRTNNLCSVVRGRFP